MKLTIAIIILIILIFTYLVNCNDQHKIRTIINTNQHKIKKEKYKKIKEKMRPFDLICFRGGGIMSKIISNFEHYTIGNGEWTHVGIIVNTEVLPIKNGKKDKLYILESTASGEWHDGTINVETGEGKFGVQIRELEDILNKYAKKENAKLAWCRLKFNPLDYDAQNSIKKLQETYNWYKDGSHNINILPIFLGFISSIYHNGLNEDKLVKKRNFNCSEFVAITYIKLGLLPNNINPSAVLPVDLIGYINQRTGMFDPPIEVLLK